MQSKTTEENDLLNGEEMDMGQIPEMDDFNADFDLDDEPEPERKKNKSQYTEEQPDGDNSAVARANARVWCESYSLILKKTCEAFSGRENPAYGLSPTEKKEYEEISYQAALAGVPLMSASTMFIIATVTFAAASATKAWADRKEVKRKTEIKEKVFTAKAIDGTLPDETPQYIRKRFETHADGKYKYSVNGEYLAAGMGEKPTKRERELIEKYKGMKYKAGAINQAVLKELTQ